MFRLLQLLELVAIFLIVTQILIPFFFQKFPKWWLFKQSFWNAERNSISTDPLDQQIAQKEKEKEEFIKETDQLKSEVDDKFKESLDLKNRADQL